MIGQEAALSCLLRVLNAAHVASFRRCMHGAKPTARLAASSTDGRAGADISM